jgi:aromatic-L-amino-acid decarboxylase
MDPASFGRRHHELVNWIAQYAEHPEQYPVLSRVLTGRVVAALPSEAPEDPASFGAIMAGLAGPVAATRRLLF